MKPEIMLSSGHYFNFLDPDPAIMTIPVIAASLSKQCRFSGHIRRFYSVAEHCVRGSYECKNPLGFLLHDAAEAFIVDIPTPMKQLLTGYRELEDRVHTIIAETYGVGFDDDVRHTDLVMLATEKRDLLPASEPWEHIKHITPLAGDHYHASGNPDIWESRYIKRFKELTQ